MDSSSHPATGVIGSTQRDVGLYDQVITVYSWFTIVANDPLSDAGKFDKARRKAAKVWAAKWENFDEQNHRTVLDLLLSAYCSWRRSPDHIPTEILYNEVKQQVKDIRKCHLISTSSTRAQNIICHFRDLIRLYRSPLRLNKTEQDIASNHEWFCKLLESTYEELEPQLSVHLQAPEQYTAAKLDSTEAFTAALSICEQDKLVDQTRNFLFGACQQHYNWEPLPNPAEMKAELAQTLHSAAGNFAMMRFNLCVDYLGETVQYCVNRRAPPDTIKAQIALLQPSIVQNWEHLFLQLTEDGQDHVVTEAAKIPLWIHNCYNTSKTIPARRNMQKAFLTVVPWTLVRKSSKPASGRSLQLRGHVANPLRRTPMRYLADDYGNGVGGPRRVDNPYVPQARQWLQRQKA